MKSQRVYLGKNLSKAAAWKKARQKAKHDFRGMNYNKATGWATLL